MVSGMGRFRVLFLVLLSGCATRLDQVRKPWPEPKALVAGQGISTVGYHEPARSLALSADNTRVSFVGSAGPSSHEGSFSRLKGQIDLPTEDPKDTRLRVEIDMESVYTKIGLLTMHLKRHDMLDVQNYPTASFVSRRVEPNAKADGGHLVTGDFSIHGVTRSVTFPARISVTPDAVTLDGTFTIRQTDFGMTESSAMTKDEVPVTVSVRVSRQ